MISDISDSGMGSEDNYQSPSSYDAYAQLHSDKIAGFNIADKIAEYAAIASSANYATQEQVIALEDAVCNAFEATNSAVKEGFLALHDVAHIHSQAIGSLKREIEYLKLPW